MFIRFNETTQIYEYDTSPGQTGAGPWLILPNVPFLDHVNIFIKNQVISNATIPSFVLSDQAEPANQKSFRLALLGRILYIQAVADDLTNATGQMTMDRLGNVSMSGGLITDTISLSGPLSNDPNILDIYQEGTWQPGLRAGDGGVGTSYDIRSGDYTRIGSRVHCNFDFRIQSANWGAGQSLIFTGFPFANASPHTASGEFSYFTITGSVYSLTFEIGSGVTDAIIRFKNTLGNTMDGVLTTANIPAGARFIGSVSYRAV